MPNDGHFNEMIEQSKSSYESQEYNPLKCWNEQDTEQDVHRIVVALANNNRDINLRPDTLLAAIRK